MSTPPIVFASQISFKNGSDPDPTLEWTLLRFLLRMSFHVSKRVLQGQYIRQHSQASAHEDVPLDICINHYVPKSQQKRLHGVTIIAAHANGFTKELYEPLFEDLLGNAAFGIHGIWIADVASQGESSTWNESNLGNAPNYFDHSRDLLHMINEYRDEMPAPLIAIGHSMGTVSLAFLSFMHPSLFQAIVMIETFISTEEIPHGAAMRRLSALRRDEWPSREATITSVESAPFFRSWDKRALDRFKAYGFRQTPTLIYPADGGVMTRSTNKHQETFMTYQGNEPRRPEAVEAFALLPMLKAPVLYLQGSQSTVTTAADRHARLRTTGTGYGGSGGAAAGMVEVELRDASHCVPFERVEETAQAISRFVDRHITTWSAKREVWRKNWHALSLADKQRMRPEWLAQIRHDRTSERKAKI